MPSTLWEDIKKTVKEGVSVAAEKTEEYTKIGKVKVDILNIKRNIDKLYEDLGKEVYGLLSSGKKGDFSGNPKVDALFNKLKDQQAALKKKESEVESIKKDVAAKTQSRHSEQKKKKATESKTEKKPEVAVKPKTEQPEKPKKTSVKPKTPKAKKPKAGA